MKQVQVTLFMTLLGELTAHADQSLGTDAHKPDHAINDRHTS